MITLRDYQEKAHELITKSFKNNLKTLLVMATGAGKSKTVVSYIHKLSNNHPNHFVFILIVKNRKLVNQLAEDTKFFNLDYGVFMANHNEFDPSKEMQVCSIDTITARQIHPHIETKKDVILIVDEADQAKSSTYQEALNKYLNRKDGRTFLLGMTATPYNGLSFFDTFIVPITPKELKARGYLVDYSYYIPKESVDYSDVTVNNGEFSAKEVSLKLDNPTMIKSCFESWLKFGEDRQTLVFCCNKKHAENFRDYVNDYYGKEVAAFVCDDTSDEERESIFKRFRNGTLRFLINIRIITRGVDIDIIGCILDLASTLNLNLHIQKLGRGSRKNPIYLDCVVIDPAKNVLNNGHFYMEHPIDLKDNYVKKKSDLEDVLMRVCSNCFRAAERVDFVKNTCPYCSFKNSPPPKKKISKYKKNKLFMESASEEAIEQRKMINEFKKIFWKKQNIGRRYRKDIARVMSHRELIKKYGLDKVMKISKAIGLKPETIKEYKPLGGMDV